jgi:hypothetical protein
MVSLVTPISAAISTLLFSPSATNFAANSFFGVQRHFERPIRALFLWFRGGIVFFVG